MKREFLIHAGDQQLLEKAIRRLNKHAKRMGYAEAKVVSVGNPYETKRLYISQAGGEVNEREVAFSVRNVEIDVPEQFLNMAEVEWLVLGQAVKVENGEAEAVSEGEHMLEVLKAGQGFGWKCQACKHPLAKAYVVKHKGTGEVKLVGQECLKQYTGADGQAIIALIEFISVIQYKEVDDEGGGGGGGSHTSLHVIDLAVFLATCNAVIRRDGEFIRRWEEGEDRHSGQYTNVETVHCTRNEALAQHVGTRPDLALDPNSKPLVQLWMRNGSVMFEVVEVTDADKVKGEELADAWEAFEVPVEKPTSNCQHNVQFGACTLCGLTETAIKNGTPNQYLLQCKALVERGWITEQSAGLAASMTKGPPKAKEPSKSVHVGTIGQRMELKGLKTVFCHTREGEYGVSTIIKFVDPVGNEYTWFASGCPTLATVGDELHDVKATIVAHDEYKGTKQTIINRVKAL